MALITSVSMTGISSFWIRPGTKHSPLCAPAAPRLRISSFWSLPPMTGLWGRRWRAINHSRVAGVPILVAINKIDKPGAEPGKVKGRRPYGVWFVLRTMGWGNDFLRSFRQKEDGIEIS